ncbi:hypothetical protein V8F33_007336 [Rhypophila sp. PSN 637]
MALAVKHLNGDASFMLTFDALLPGQPPYRILIDPWITGKSKILHSKISVTRHKETPCITSLAELPEPDLVVISQNKSDHCNEDSLRQLPPKDTKTIILAEPAAARTIRGWKYFEKSKVRTIPKWGDPRLTARQMVMRIKVPSASPGQIETGEVTVAFISQRKDLSGLHGAIGITYRPPQTVTPPPRPADKSFTPPITPRSCKSCGHLRPTPLVLSQPSEGGTQTTPYSPLPPSPTNSTLRSVRSASSLATTLRDGGYSTASLASLARPLSVIFSPHGINYESLQSYTTSHLIAEAALPLTALLHCFDSVSNPWWLGGNILLGAPAGIETASKLGARAWISTHDGDKIVKGIATSFLRTRKWTEEDVLGALSAAELAWRKEKQTLKNKRVYSSKSKSTATLPESPTSTIANSTTADKVGINTDLIRLRIGEEVMLTNGPILMIDRDSLTAKVQDTPTMVNIQHDLKTPSGPILRPPPRSLNRPPPTILLGSKTVAAPVDPATHGIDSAKQNTEGQQHLATDRPLTPPTTSGSASDAASPPPLTLMPTTSTSSTVSFPEIPASFTERRYTNKVRSRGNSKTHSESDFASLEAVMMMRQLEQQN